MLGFPDCQRSFGIRAEIVSFWHEHLDPSREDGPMLPVPSATLPIFDDQTTPPSYLQTCFAEIQRANNIKIWYRYANFIRFIKSRANELRNNWKKYTSRRY
ncbi:hypothetical protein PUN4_230108 [Paraburkholderia unamae]|nr:hypothetical protein PUN4_230108 [Paraburkholderia unamae]